MRASETTRFFVVSLAVALVSSGCGFDALTDITDVGIKADAGPSDGAGVLESTDWPSTARRGPVLLTVDLTDPEQRVTGVRIEREAADGWTQITARWSEKQGNRLRWAWDSFADVSVDGPVKLRFVASGLKGGEVAIERTMDLRNNPDTDRVVLVSHSGAETDTGASTKGNELSAFVWNGQKPGALDSTPTPMQRVSVGNRPGLIRAAPHGRAAAVDITEFREWAIDIVETPLVPIVDDIKVTHTLTLPEGTPMAFQWSPDGRYFWVIGNGPNALWRFEPSEDLSSWPAPTRVIDLPGPAMKFAIDPVLARLFVYCGFGGIEGELDKLILYDQRGAELGRYDDDLVGTNGIAVSADGTLGLWTSLMGDDVRVFSLENGVSPIGSPVETGSPYEPHFHPSKDSHAALVSSWDSSSVTPLTVSANSVAAGSAVKGLPLAAEIDRIERGDQSGVFLVPVVSTPASIKAVRLNVDGTAEKLDVSVSLGSGYGATPTGIAIQR